MAVIAAALIVLSAPLIGAARSALRAALPREYLYIVNGAVAVLATSAIVLAWARIRDRRVWRRIALVSAVALAVVSAIALRMPSAEVSAVERVHFIEYGFLTWLFYRAFGPTPTDGRGDGASLALPMLAGLLVGTADEAFQWFVPNRVGELGDIFLNLASISAGLLLSLAMAPPQRFTLRIAPHRRRAVAWTAAALVVAIAAFLQTAQLGYLVDDPSIGTFRSRFTAARLHELATERAARWRVEPPPRTLVRLSREDQYVAEAAAHVQARNEAFAADVHKSWLENRILETYFEPVLDFPSYVIPAGARWPTAQRADAETRALQTSEFRPFESAVWRDYVLVWPSGRLWLVTGVTAAVLFVTGLVPFTRRSSGPVLH